MIEETRYPKRYRKRSLSSKMQPRYKNTQYSTSLFPIFERVCSQCSLHARYRSRFPLAVNPRRNEKNHAIDVQRKVSKSIVRIPYPIFPFFARQIQIQIKISLSFSKRRSERQSSRLKCRLGQRFQRLSRGEKKKWDIRQVTAAI